MIKDVIKTGLKLLLGRGIGSQYGEDKTVATLLPEKGVYVDVGAYHPHLYSNTYLLYKKGWHGVAVEPNPTMRILWRLFRPRDVFVNAGVGKPGMATYYMYKDGAYNDFKRIDRRVIAEKEVKIVPLSNFLNTVVDFLNIDCEGMDYEILQTHDWNIKPTVIAVEGEEGGESHHFLRSKGYSLVAKKGLTLIFKLQ